MPVLSGFLPIPLAMMIPFMGAQSLVLGKQFGEGFQYGKRKISAMTNEEFNKITPAKLAQNNAEELKQMIPSMQASITDMRSFQSFIVRELIETVKQLPNDIFGAGAPQDINRGLANAENNIFNEWLGFKQLLTGGDPKNQIPKWLQAAAEEISPATPTPSVTSGPIGPQLPTLDSFYRNMTFDQINNLGAATLQRIPKTQRDLILKRIADEKPRIPTSKEILSKTNVSVIATTTENSQVRQIAIYHALAVSAMAQYKKDNKLTNLLKSLQEYNRVVAGFGKSNLMYDTQKSYTQKKLVPRTRRT